MANKNLEDLILKNVVIHYIQTPEPIGSSQLQQILDLSVSSATIRNYLKKLVADGYLDKLHSSSGRIPTFQAFREFWLEEFKSKPRIELQDLANIQSAGEFFGIYGILSKDEPNALSNLYNIENRILVLDFEKNQVCIEYDPNLEIFLSEFTGHDSSDLLRLAYENMINELPEKLQAVMGEDLITFNDEALLCLANKDKNWGKSHFAEFFDGSVINTLNYGVYFEHCVPKDHLLVKTRVFQGEKPMSLLALGHMSRDFNGFFNSL
ncbi:MAG: hypothetical protein ACTTIC_03835 [Helicobacteraceae bacterium]